MSVEKNSSSFKDFHLISNSEIVRNLNAFASYNRVERYVQIIGETQLCALDHLLPEDIIDSLFVDSLGDLIKHSLPIQSQFSEMHWVNEDFVKLVEEDLNELNEALLFKNMFTEKITQPMLKRFVIGLLEKIFDDENISGESQLVSTILVGLQTQPWLV